MGRLGVALEDLPRVSLALKASPHLILEGLSTHLASSEVLDAPSVDDQLKRFDEARMLLRREGFDPPLIHAANTGAVISRRESWNTMVRPGIAMYGYHLPFERAGREVSGSKLRLAVKPVLDGRHGFSPCVKSAAASLWVMAAHMSLKLRLELRFFPSDTPTD